MICRKNRSWKFAHKEAFSWEDFLLKNKHKHLEKELKKIMSLPLTLVPENCIRTKSYLKWKKGEMENVCWTSHRKINRVIPWRFHHKLSYQEMDSYLARNFKGHLSRSFQMIFILPEWTEIRSKILCSVVNSNLLIIISNKGNILLQNKLTFWGETDRKNIWHCCLKILFKMCQVIVKKYILKGTKLEST